MRREFFAGVSRYFVTRYCPWACKIVKVDGGYFAFESIEDWRTIFQKEKMTWQGGKRGK